MTNYPVGDYLIRIKNAARAGRREVVVKNARFVESVGKALVKAKILESVEASEGVLTSRLAYHKKAPTLLDLKLVSKPGLRIYMGLDELSTRKRRNASRLLLSTPEGILNSDEARKKGVGGEVIAEVW